MEYITKILGVTVKRKEWEDKNLPFFLLEKYTFQQIMLEDQKCLFITPLGHIDSINTIQKHIKIIHQICQCPVVLELKQITSQKRDILIQAHIPFVVPDKQIYLPFLGIMLQEKFDTPANNQGKFYPSTQQIFFSILLGKCKPVVLSELAKRINVTPMTVTRAAKQLCDTGYFYKKGSGDRAKKILVTDNKPKEVYELIKPYLICPVRKTIYLPKEQIEPEMFEAGLTALSKVSMINPDRIQCFGTADSAFNKYAKNDVLIDEDKQCALQIWKYDPRVISGTNAADPYSLALSFESTTDERILQAIDEMIERTL